MGFARPLGRLRIGNRQPSPTAVPAQGPTLAQNLDAHLQGTRTTWTRLLGGPAEVPFCAKKRRCGVIGPAQQLSSSIELCDRRLSHTFVLPFLLV